MKNNCPCKFHEGYTCLGCYLETISKAVRAISAMIISDNINLETEVAISSLKELSEIEQSTADFLEEICDESVESDIIIRSKKSFIASNELVIAYLEKIQLQGYNFGEFTTALKLENQTLKEEIDFL